MQIPSSTTSNFQSGGHAVSRGSVLPIRYSLKLDSVTQNQIVTTAVLNHQKNLSDADLETFLSQIKDVSLDKREQARQTL